MAEICLICLQNITLNFIKLDDGIESTEIRSRLTFCVPDAVFHMVKNPIMCNSCYIALHSAYTFISQCRSSNKRILKYIESTTVVSLKADEENKFLVEHNVELDNNLTIKQRKCRKNKLNNSIHVGTEQMNNSSKFNNNCSEKLHQVKTERCKSNSSSYLENEQSISKLDIKLECDQETSVFAEVGCTKSEVLDVKPEENITSAFTHNEDKVKHKQPSLKKSKKKTSKKVKKKSTSQYECNICDYCTTINSNFRRHIRIHCDDKPYTCDKCDYSTSVKCNLQSHLPTHLEKKPYQCDKCNFNTAHQSNLKKHMYTHEEKTFKCQFATTNQTALKKHTSVHKRDKSYKCDQCKLCFADKYKLDRHKAIHAEEKAFFKCGHCEYSSIRKDTLMRHIKRRHANR